MKLGTPGFQGERLTEARESRGLTKTALADLLGLSTSAIVNYELGQQTPRQDIMEKIYRVLDFPPLFFSWPKNNKNEKPIFFRSMSTATKTARTRISWKIDWLKETVIFLENFLELPEANFPNIDLPKDTTALSMRDIDDISAECRKYWGLKQGVISNVILLLENNGTIIGRGEVAADKLDALSQIGYDNRPYIYLSSEKLSAVRSRFDAGHELGHIIMHTQTEQSKLNTPSDYKLIENQAHRFAASFLLPEESFLNDLNTPSLEMFQILKEKWKVSIGMMIKRCQDLKVISETEASRLWMNYSRRGYRRNEPLDEILEVEEPRLLNRSIKIILENGLQSKSDILLNLPYRKSDLEELLNLPSGYLNEDDPIIEFKPRLKKSVVQNLDKIEAEIIPFKKDK